MHVWLFIFIISCILVLYNYGGYVIPVYLLNRLGRRHPTPRDQANSIPRNPADPISPNPVSPGDPGLALPTVSFIVAAYNEKDCIREKVLNSLDQDYPPDKLEFIFIADGSTDETSEITAGYPRIRTLYQPERAGKSAAINRAVAAAKHEILIFSDANTILNKDAVQNIARHYYDPTVGGVAGEKKVLAIPDEAGEKKGDEVGDSEGLYWKYESFLKRQDSAFYSVVGAAGELFSVRASLYEPLPHSIILDDFVLSLSIAQKGYRILYEPDAYAMELPSFSIGDEQKRKIRIAAGGFQAIGLLTPLLAFWRYPKLSYLYISHRVLRWAVSPFCLILAFVSNIFLFTGDPGPLYGLLLLAQIGFYGMAALAAFFPAIKNKNRLVKLSYYFVFMNTSVILGFFRFLRGKQAATWEKARRAQSPNPIT
jgi:biofilm PGA synthesis N-glycosyltransferase PgaC